MSRELTGSLHFVFKLIRHSAVVSAFQESIVVCKRVCACARLKLVKLFRICYTVRRTPGKRRMHTATERL